MVSDDPYHTGWEEVHLPAACSFPMDLGETAAGTGARDPSLIGCMDKGAHNYKPTARQPAGVPANMYRRPNATGGAALTPVLAPSWTRPTRFTARSATAS